MTEWFRRRYRIESFRLLDHDRALRNGPYGANKTTFRDGEIEIPRWLQVPIGLVLGFLIILIGLASVALSFPRLQDHPIFSFAAGIVLLLACLWVFERCVRLVIGRKKQFGLMSPRTLHVISWLILVFSSPHRFHWLLPENGACGSITGGRLFDCLFRASLAGAKPRIPSPREDSSARFQIAGLRLLSDQSDGSVSCGLLHSWQPGLQQSSAF